MWFQEMLHVFCGNMRSAYPVILGTFVILYLEGTSYSWIFLKKKHWRDIMATSRSNLDGKMLPLLHFAIYKRVSSLQPLHCALSWVTRIGYHLVPGPLLWVNIYLPHIMSRPLKKKQSYRTNQWSNSLLQKITLIPNVQNWICSTIQKFFFVIDVIQSK
jgi:hypothetical protein